MIIVYLKRLSRKRGESVGILLPGSLEVNIPMGVFLPFDHSKVAKYLGHARVNHHHTIITQFNFCLSPVLFMTENNVNVNAKEERFYGVGAMPFESVIAVQYLLSFDSSWPSRTVSPLKQRHALLSDFDASPKLPLRFDTTLSDKIKHFDVKL